MSNSSSAGQRARSSFVFVSVPLSSVPLSRESAYKICYDLLHLILPFLMMLLLVLPLPFRIRLQCKMYQHTLSFDSSYT
jgi:hypothetical protein